MAAGTSTGKVAVWDVRMAKYEHPEVISVGSSIISLAFKSPSNIIGIGTMAGLGYVRDFVSGSRTRFYMPTPIHSLAFDTSSDMLVGL